MQSLANRAPFTVEIVGVPSLRLPQALEAAIYYVVAESLTNAAKHAGASEARVEMSTTGDAVVVEIRDNGGGGALEHNILHLLDINFFGLDGIERPEHLVRVDAVAVVLGCAGGLDQDGERGEAKAVVIGATFAVTTQDWAAASAALYDEAVALLAE